jgi:hypothetical protein
MTERAFMVGENKISVEELFLFLSSNQGMLLRDYGPYLVQFWEKHRKECQ